MGPYGAGSTYVVGGNSQSYALAELIPYLPEDLLGEALAIAKAIDQVQPRSHALIALSQCLAPDSLKLHDELLSAVISINEGWTRGGALVGIISNLSLNLRGRALASAAAIGDKRVRCMTLSGLAPHLPQSYWAEYLRILLDTVPGLWRGHALESLAAAAKPIAELGSTNALEEIRRAIRDVSVWYP